MSARAERSRVERFVTLVVGGGLGSVAGLWLVELSAIGTPAWMVGAALAAAGAVALAYGVVSQLEWSRQ